MYIGLHELSKKPVRPSSLETCICHVLWGVPLYSDLRAAISRVSSERDAAESDAAQLRDQVDELHDMFDDEKAKLLEKLKRELACKDRQIESLEEQLRNATQSEIKRLKRGTAPLCARHVLQFPFFCCATNRQQGLACFRRSWFGFVGGLQSCLAPACCACCTCKNRQMSRLVDLPWFAFWNFWFFFRSACAHKTFRMLCCLVGWVDFSSECRLHKSNCKCNTCVIFWQVLHLSCVQNGITGAAMCLCKGLCILSAWWICVQLTAVEKVFCFNCRCGTNWSVARRKQSAEKPTVSVLKETPKPFAR